jgi:hypothetical protein
MGLWCSSFFTLLSLIAVPVLADVSVLPTNSTTDLAWSSSARFRIQGSSPLSGQILAPLTHYLVNLSSSQAQVRPRLGFSALSIFFLPFLAALCLLHISIGPALMLIAYLPGF